MWHLYQYAKKSHLFSASATQALLYPQFQSHCIGGSRKYRDSLIDSSFLKRSHFSWHQSSSQESYQISLWPSRWNGIWIDNPHAAMRSRLQCHCYSKPLPIFQTCHFISFSNLKTTLAYQPAFQFLIAQSRIIWLSKSVRSIHAYTCGALRGGAYLTHESIILSDGTIALSRVLHLKQHPLKTGFGACTNTALAFVKNVSSTLAFHSWTQSSQYILTLRRARYAGCLRHLSDKNSYNSIVRLSR